MPIYRTEKTKDCTPVSDFPMLENPTLKKTASR